MTTTTAPESTDTRDLADGKWYCDGNGVIRRFRRQEASGRAPLWLGWYDSVGNPVSFDVEKAPPPYREVATPTPLIVERKIEVTIEQKVDMVAHFLGMRDSERRRYADVDLAEAGWDEEWQRPMAYLTPDEQDVDAGLGHGTGLGREDTGSVEVDVHVIHRPGSTERVYGYADREWTEDDFTALRAHVPWLDSWHRAQEDGGDPADLARVPGPLDRPMF